MLLVAALKVETDENVADGAAAAGAGAAAEAAISAPSRLIREARPGLKNRSSRSSATMRPWIVSSCCSEPEASTSAGEAVVAALKPSDEKEPASARLAMDMRPSGRTTDLNSVPGLLPVRSKLLDAAAGVAGTAFRPDAVRRCVSGCCCCARAGRALVRGATTVPGAAVGPDLARATVKGAAPTVVAAAAVAPGERRAAAPALVEGLTVGASAMRLSAVPLAVLAAAAAM
jgi:hypothetical protein